MALFNRKNRTDVPEEIQEYYQTERRERAGIAWLLAFGTLIITIVLAAGVFFAGRWAYRKIAGSDNGNGTDTTQVAQDEQQQEEQPADTSDDEAAEQPSEEEQQAEEERQRQEEEARRAEEERQAEEQRQAEQERQAEEERQQAASQEAEQEDAQTPSGQVGGATDERQIATTGDSIPNTGPGDTVAIFFAVSVLGYVMHRLYTTKQND